MQRGIAILVLLSVTFCVTGLASALAGPVTALEDAGLVGPVYIIVERSYWLDLDEETPAEGSLYYKSMRVFDRNGNITESFKQGSSDDTEKKTTMEYDENGYLREMMSSSLDGIVKGRSVGEYDAERNLSTIKVYDGDGVLQGMGEVIYDDRGILVETRTFTVDGELVGRVVYRYDEAGRQVGQETYERSDLVETTVREFAANGEVARAESYRPDGTQSFCSESTYALVYDDVGNWVRRETTSIDCLEGRSREEMMSVTVRDITYHE